MNPRKFEDLSNVYIMDLFRIEAETQTTLLTSILLELERGAPSSQQLETLMRAAHSLKGAARIVSLQPVVSVAHAMEDSFVSAQQGKLQIRQREIDLLLRGVDLLSKLAKDSQQATAATEVNEFVTALAAIGSGAPKPLPAPPPPTAPPAQPTAPVPTKAPPPAPAESTKPTPGRGPESQERVVRLAAENLNRLLVLAGESLVESRWLRPFADSLQRLKRHHTELAQRLESLRNVLSQEEISERVEGH